MKEKKTLFLKPSFIISLISGVNFGVLFFFMQEIANLERNIFIVWVLSVFLIEAIIILFSIDYYLESPIKDLEYKMKSFLWGRFKNKKITFEKSNNEHVDYILSSFDILLNSMKWIKTELLSWREIKWEVELAKEIQDKLLKKKLEKVPSLDIVAKSTPAWEIWGDSYDIIKQDDNYYIYVWDVTWHWVASGFVMVMVNALISGFSKFFIKWNEILAHTNEILKPRIKSNILMTLLMIRWNEKEKRLFMSWAWHEYLMIYKAKEKKCHKIKSWGLALWMTKNVHKILKEQELRFEKDDIIVLYSDGITEAKIKGEPWEWIMFWEDRLVQTIENSPNIIINWEEKKTAKWVFNNITIELSKFMWYKFTQYDDITLTVVHYKWGDNYDDNLANPDEIDDSLITQWRW